MYCAFVATGVDLIHQLRFIFCRPCLITACCMYGFLPSLLRDFDTKKKEIALLPAKKTQTRADDQFKKSSSRMSRHKRTATTTAFASSPSCTRSFHGVHWQHEMLCAFLARGHQTCNRRRPTSIHTKYCLTSPTSL